MRGVGGWKTSSVVDSKSRKAAALLRVVLIAMMDSRREPGTLVRSAGGVPINADSKGRSIKGLGERVTFSGSFSAGKKGLGMINPNPVELVKRN